MERDFDSVLKAAQLGDQGAFAQLYRSYQPAVLRYLRMHVGGGAAEDVAAEAWYEVARGIARFDGDESGFRGWLFTIARHRSVDWARAASRRLSDPVPTSAFSQVSASDDPAASAHETMSTEDALRLIATLPREQAEIVALRAIAGLDVAQVAELLGKRPGAVRVAAHRGLRRLASELSERVGAEV